MFRWMNISFFRLGACLLMFISLAWLTVSLPYVAAAKKAYALSKDKADDTNNPLTNTTEEKNPSVNMSEEYLHHSNESNTAPDPSLEYSWHHHPADKLPVHTLDYFSPPPNGTFSF